MRDKLIAWVWYETVKSKKENSLRFFILYSIHRMLGLIFLNDISTNVVLRGLPIIHHGFGIIVGSGVELGDNVLLRARVTLGEGRTNSKTAPKIGDNVEIGVGAVIVGSTIIENNARVSPNRFICNE